MDVDAVLRAIVITLAWVAGLGWPLAMTATLTRWGRRLSPTRRAVLWIAPYVPAAVVIALLQVAIGHDDHDDIALVCLLTGGVVALIIGCQVMAARHGRAAWYIPAIPLIAGCIFPWLPWMAYCILLASVWLFHGSRPLDGPLWMALAATCGLWFAMIGTLVASIQAVRQIRRARYMWWQKGETHRAWIVAAATEDVAATVMDWASQRDTRRPVRLAGSVVASGVIGYRIRPRKAFTLSVEVRCVPHPDGTLVLVRSASRAWRSHADELRATLALLAPVRDVTAYELKDVMSVAW